MISRMIIRKGRGTRLIWGEEAMKRGKKERKKQFKMVGYIRIVSFSYGVLSGFGDGHLRI